MAANTTFWLAVAIVLAIVVLALIVPLLRHPRRVLARAEYDLAIYKDQLRELEEDIANGLIPPEEAKAARNDIARRILAADEARRKAREALEAGSSLSDRLVGVVSAVVLVPALAVGLYLMRGHPGMPDLPMKERLRHAAERGDIAAMVRQVEERLRANPDDVEGWRAIAPIYLRMGRLNEAAEAYRNLIRLEKPNPDLYNMYGEILVFRDGGKVSKEARRSFEEALKLDPKNPKSRFYLAQADLQAGKTEKALAALKALLDDLPQDFSGRRVIERQIARIEKTLKQKDGEKKQSAAAAPSTSAQASSGPDPEAVRQRMKDMANMSPEERQRMIRSMVEGLAERLKENPRDLQGWLRLIRAWGVLGEKDKARAALKEARKAFADDENALRRIDDLAKRMAL